ncbi:unnamed protein product [Echinostoma caproni]|uniref:SSD domain-containing protein n=1 Tax=Echinostoma caproni TaxID=27848 RepID=A0A183AQN8_9TREM|nr:unnamed protein product [Echinostoma caproni]
MEWFQSNQTTMDEVARDMFDLIIADYLDHLMFCANAPMSVNSSLPNSEVSCLASSGIPVQPTIALGGFKGKNYNESTCIVLTFLVNNNPDPRSPQVKKAELWESEYIRTVNEWARNHSETVIVSFQAERSVEDEINRQSDADILIVLISYLVMFVYVSIFLASYRSCRTLFVDLRITLGLGGVLIVILSVVSSVGMWSYVGTPATLIIIEVIPFLVLAVGVDNIFILVHDFEFDEQEADQILCSEERRQNCAVGRSNPDWASQVGDDVPLHPHPNLTQTIRAIVAARVGRTLGRVGPSILLTSVAESVAFFCGSLTSMPAVRAFALYAGVAILFNFLLQIFAFVALLTLDARRRAVSMNITYTILLQIIFLH